MASAAVEDLEVRLLTRGAPVWQLDTAEFYQIILPSRQGTQTSEHLAMMGDAARELRRRVVFFPLLRDILSTEQDRHRLASYFREIVSGEVYECISPLVVRDEDGIEARFVPGNLMVNHMTGWLELVKQVLASRSDREA